MLALEPGRTVSADRLAEGLWGDSLPPSAAKMVQLYVSHLRRVLDGDGGSNRDARSRLRARARRGRGRRRCAPSGWSRRRGRARRWRCGGASRSRTWPTSRSPATEIRRLEELRLRAAELAIDADLAAGRHAEVIAELDALVAANPLRERLHAQRMLALYRAGRQSEALAAYRAARAELVEQIGVEPGAELQRLHEQILAHDPALDLPAAAEPESRAPPRATLARGAGGRRGARAGRRPGVRDHPRARARQPRGDPRGRCRACSTRTAAASRPSIRSAAPRRGDGGRTISLGGQPARRHRFADRPRHDAVVTITTGGAPAALAFGAGSLWVADGEGRQVAQVDPASNKVLQRIEAANAPRSLAVAEGALWVVSGVDGGVHRSSSTARRPRARSRSAPGRPRSPPAPAHSGWRARKPGRSRASTRARAPWSPRSTSATHRARWRWAKARSGSSTAPTARSRESIPARTRSSWIVRGGHATRPPSRSERAPCGWPAARRAPWLASTPAGHVWSSGARREAALRRSRSPAARCGSRPSRPSRHTGAERCGRTCRHRVPVPANSLIHDTLLPGHLDGPSLAYDGLVAYRRVRRRRRDARRRARHTASRAELRRAHLCLHAATRHPLLRRDAGQAGRLPCVDGALPGRHPRHVPALLRRDRRRTALHERAGAATSRGASNRMRTRGRSPST